MPIIAVTKMIIKAQTFFGCAILVCLAIACSEVSAPSSEASVPQIKSPTLPAQVKQTASPAPDTKVEVNCLPVNEFGEVIPLDNLVINPLNTKNLLRYNSELKTFESFGKEIDSLRGAFISPNGNYIAYSAQNGMLVVEEAGSMLMEVPWLGSWRNIAGWLDNQNLIISNRVGNEAHDSLLVLNVFSNEREQISNNFPDALDIFPYPDWGPFSFALFVPNQPLDRVVFASYPQDDDLAGAIVLWDRGQNQIVTYVTGTAFYGKGPKWTSDGGRFVTSNTLTVTFSVHQDSGIDQELFIIDKNGRVDRATFLTNFFSETEIGTYSWSYDETKIAFWLTADPNEYPELYNEVFRASYQRLSVVNSLTGQTIDYCIPGDQYSGLSPAPIWHPELQYVVIENRFSENESRLILVDLLNNQATVIAENASVVGWITE